MLGKMVPLRIYSVQKTLSSLEPFISLILVFNTLVTLHGLSHGRVDSRQRTMATAMVGKSYPSIHGLSRDQ